MEISDIIAEISRLNHRGIELADKAMFKEAANQHSKAVDLAAAQMPKMNLNPDYFLFSISRLVYVTRSSRMDCASTMPMLEGALKITADDRAAIKPENRTFFGEATIKEEMALLRRFFPAKGDELNDYLKSQNMTQRVIGLFSEASKNINRLEIESQPYRDSRLLRAYGLMAPISLKVAERMPNKKEKEQEIRKAIQWADQELQARLKTGENKGMNLANAYHSLGLAQATAFKEAITRGDGSTSLYEACMTYYKARTNLIFAQDLASKADNHMVASVVELRMAWLELDACNPNGGKIMRGLMDSVFKAQENPKSAWGPLLRQELQPQMHDVCQKLDKTYLQRYQNMYRA
ncbi:MAG: hypothetical protein V1866_04135 [archaeon]